MEPGDELVLHPGEYRGPCGIRVSGRPGAPLTIRARDPRQRPRIVYDGRDHNVIEIRASHIVLQGLEFGPAQTDVDGVRIFSGDDIVVEQCRFTGLKGIAVVANHASSRGVVIRRNEVVSTDATAMYFGCQNGTSCALTDLTVEGNYIHTVRSPDPGIGYGIQVKLNSIGVIRNNMVLETKGPGIMVYGSRDSGQPSVVEGNFVMGSRTTSGIVIGGGPAVVRNNIAVANAGGGIGVEDYGRRHLIRNIVIAHNSLYANRLGAIVMGRGTGGDVAIVNNAMQSPPGVASLPAVRPGLRLAGNVDCAAAPCFRNPEARDFSPGPGLAGPTAAAPDRWIPAEDFFGLGRPAPPTVGAVEGSGGPVPLGVRR